MTHVGTVTDGSVSDVQVTSPTLPPSCVLAAIPALAPHDSATVTCTATPDRSFTNAASASAVDGADRTMTADAAPLAAPVVNPAVRVTVVATPTEARHGADVDFEVTVHNIGNVDLAVELTNDRAPDCDLPLPRLAAGSVRGTRCTVRTPTDESTQTFANNATYTATPLPSAGGDPLTGTESASVALLPGQAPTAPTPGADPADPDSSPAPPTSTPRGQSSNKKGDLAFTGAAILVPLAVGAVLVLAGTVAVVATRRRRRSG